MGNVDVMELHASNDEVKNDALIDENVEQARGETRNLDKQQTRGKHPEDDLVSNNLPLLQGNVELVETVSIVEKMTGIESIVLDGNNDVTLQKKVPSSHKIGGTSVRGVKRPRMACDDRQPFVQVIYNSLPRQSKRKLEELLHQWSEWHTRQCSSKDSDEVLESGDETYFPVLHVDLGLEKTSTVSFWIDSQVNEKQSNGSLSVNENAAPLYDREYASGLTSMDDSNNQERGVETLDASRCFNCGSYNHSLKECPKPRDNVAVNNARKQHQSKMSRTLGPRIATRYYQKTPGGKYDDLKPGVLDLETRKLLNLGELDPPPWLNRMREIGYPPGYLDTVDEGQSSGIIVYADEETREEEDKEILKSNTPAPQKKMSVDFPGINAPIPKQADERRWGTSRGSVSSDCLRNRANLRSNSFSEFTTPKRPPSDHRGGRDSWDGGFPGYSPTMFDYSRGYSGFSPRYDHPSNYSGCHPSYASDPLNPGGDPAFMRSLGEPMHDRWRSPSFREGLFYPPDALSPYAHSRQPWPPHDYAPSRMEDPAYERHWRPY